MVRSDSVPSLADFEAACQEAFAFLLPLGFQRVLLPSHRSTERFQVRYSNGVLSIVVRGEGYGTSASVHFETSDKWAYEIYFTPPELRPTRKRKKGSQLGQLDLIREAARRIQDHCHDLLAGDL